MVLREQLDFGVVGLSTLRDTALDEEITHILKAHLGIALRLAQNALVQCEEVQRICLHTAHQLIVHFWRQELGDFPLLEIVEKRRLQPRLWVRLPWRLDQRWTLFFLGF